MVAPDSERHAPAAGKGGLYTTFVPSPDPFKERILDGLAHVLRVVRPTLVFEGRTYRYFLHPYNRTMRGERCVEGPAVTAAASSRSAGRPFRPSADRGSSGRR